MNALQLYDPLFQYLCGLNRLARRRLPADYATVRSEILDIIRETETRAQDDANLREQTKALHLPILYYVDDIIAQSALPFARQWHQDRVGYSESRLAGDEVFFDFLDETLDQPPSPVINERLAIYYLCLGLGFTGFYFNNPDRLKKYMQAIYPRVRPLLEAGESGRLSPDSYSVTDRRPFSGPPRRRPLLVALATTLLVLSALPFYYLFYRHAASVVHETLRQIAQSSYQGQTLR